MQDLPREEVSYWQSSVRARAYPALDKDLEVDVAIVGAGITGLTAAYLLKKSGLKVAVLEKNTIGSGTTSHTTGKVTSQHNLIYADLEKQLGRNVAKIYAEANQTAVREIIHIIREEKISCDLEIDDNYVFTTEPDQVARFKREAMVAAQLGLPATFEIELPLPFRVRAAVKFANQAKFNVQKYVLGLADLVNGQGSYVFEHSNVTHFHDGQPAAVKTKKAEVIARDIIVATKIPGAPLIARFAYAALEHPHTSYIIAGEMDDSLSGMYISPDKNHYSILPIRDGARQLLLIGGESHTPGLGNARRRHQRLADYAKKYFQIHSVAYRWKGMDYMAYDHLPLVGKAYPWSKHLYTASGFKKWGLSTSMVAGMILHDTIVGQPNTWAPVFNSMRLRPILSIPREIARSLRNR